MIRIYPNDKVGTRFVVLSATAFNKQARAVLGAHTEHLQEILHDLRSNTPGAGLPPPVL